MSKQELAQLIRKIEVMQAAMRVMQQEMLEIGNRLRFIPVSQSSSSSSDDDCENEHPRARA